jgi:hypothetical protein
MMLGLPVAIAAVAGGTVLAVAAGPAAAGTHHGASAHAVIGPATQQYPLELIVKSTTIPLVSYHFGVSRQSQNSGHTPPVRLGALTVKAAIASTFPALLADLRGNTNLNDIQLLTSASPSNNGTNYTTAVFKLEPDPQTLERTHLAKIEYAGSDQPASGFQTLTFDYAKLAVSYTAPPPVT